MGLGKIVLVIALLLALAGYRLYTPIPAGYSSKSGIQLQILLGSVKLMDDLALLSSYVGISSYVDSYRAVLNFLLKHVVVKPAPDIKVTDAVFDGIPVRVYEPINRSNAILPGIVYYHGGGFAFGNYDYVANFVSELCTDTRSVVVSVDYRLAPEHPFPAAFEDCVTATKYFLKNANKFAVDPHRVAVAGDSAGGNLAAVVPLKLRDEAFSPAIKLQVLLYPFTQSLDLQLPSMIQNAEGPVLTRYLLAFFTDIYLNGNMQHIITLLDNRHVSPSFKKSSPVMSYLNVSRLPAKYITGYQQPSVEVGDESLWNALKDRLLNPYYSPLVADSLKGLPTAYVFTGEFDPLRDDGILYVYRLKEAGVKVEHAHSDIAIHGIMNLAKEFPETQQMFDHMAQYIVANL